MKDFTHESYKDLLKAFLNENYQFIRVIDYFNNNFDSTKPLIMMRHDVDRYPLRSLAMAKLESSMNIKATYYFRTIPSTFKPEIIKEIASLGHEIGYHYESLAECNGDYEKAISDFQKNLENLRKIYPIKNIAMHGRPTSKWDSRDLWKKYDYKKFKIISEPYFDIDFNRVFYATDAGRAWGDESINLRDKVTTKFNFKINSTNDLIDIIKNKTLPNEVMLNIHPEHWSKNSLEWYEIYTIRKLKNYVKKVLIKSS